MSEESYLLPEVGAEDAARRAERAAASRANLKRFQPGESGNPAGRRSGGAYVTEWINAFLITDDEGRPRYTLADLRAIVEDPNEAPARILAARRILSACRDGEKWVIDRKGKAHRGGTDSEPGRDFDRIADRLEGKPVASVNVHSTSDEPVGELIDELRGLIESHPVLGLVLGDTLPDLALPAKRVENSAELDDSSAE